MDSTGATFVKRQFFPTRGSVASRPPNAAHLICTSHQRRMKLFCEEEGVLLCFLCSQSPEHSAYHGHRSVSQAAKTYREYFLTQIKSLWKKKYKTHKIARKAANILRWWEGFINLRKKMIQAEYPKLCRYLYEEKQKHIDLLEFEGKIIFLGLENNVFEMTNLGKILLEMYHELKKMCQKTDEALLQDVKTVMEKYESVSLVMPQPLELQLSAKPISGLLDRLHCFRVSINLGPNISNFRVSLFEDLRHLQYYLSNQDSPCHLARPEYTLSWGAQSFISGKHYWEVGVRDDRNWIIGVCSEPWRYRDDLRLNSKGIFLLLSVRVDDSCWLFSASPLLPHYIQRPNGSVGIFLDYDFGVIDFINVAERSLICNFLPGFFSSPLTPFICYGSK